MLIFSRMLLSGPTGSRESMSFVRFFSVRWSLAAVVACPLVIAGLQGAGARPASAAPARAAAPGGSARSAARAPSLPPPPSVAGEDARAATPSGAAAGALATARSSGRPAEILADRTDFSQTFANPDGTMTYDAS